VVVRASRFGVDTCTDTAAMTTRVEWAAFSPLDENCHGLSSVSHNQVDPESRYCPVGDKVGKFPHVIQ